MEEIPITAPPVFETVTVWVAVGTPTVPLKVSEVGVTVRTGTVSCWPVPCRLIVCAGTVPLLFTPMVPLKVVAEVGVNVTVSVQVAPDASAVRPAHVPPVTVNAPDAVYVVCERVSGALPVFSKMTVIGALVEPTFTLPNCRKPAGPAENTSSV